MPAEVRAVPQRRRTGPGREQTADPGDGAAGTRVVLATLQGYRLQRAAFRSDEPELFSQGLRLMFRA